jgi:hypothetical protein
MAALRRLCEPRFLLSGWDSNSALPRLFSEDGRKRAVDGHFLRFSNAVLTPRCDNILEQLARDGLFLSYFAGGGGGGSTKWVVAH